MARALRPRDPATGRAACAGAAPTSRAVTSKAFTSRTVTSKADDAKDSIALRVKSGNRRKSGSKDAQHGSMGRANGGTKAGDSGGDLDDDADEDMNERGAHSDGAGDEAESQADEQSGDHNGTDGDGDEDAADESGSEASSLDSDRSVEDFTFDSDGSSDEDSDDQMSTSSTDSEVLTGAEDEFTAPVKPWSSKVASPRLLRLHNEVAALTPKASDIIRAGLSDVRLIVREYAKPLRRHRAELQAACSLALRLWRKIARHEAATGDRNRTGTPVHCILDASLAEIYDLIDSLKDREMDTLVKRTQNNEQFRERIDLACFLLRFHHRFADSWLNLDQTRNEGSTPSKLDTAWAADAIVECADYIREDLGPLEDLVKPDAFTLLEFFALLQAISHRSTVVDPAVAHDDAVRLNRLLQLQEARANPTALEQHAIGNAREQWKRNVIMAANTTLDQCDHAESLLQTNAAHEMLFVTFSNFVQLGVYFLAAKVGQMLVITMRNGCGPHGPLPRKERMDLSYALASLSWVYRHNRDQQDSRHSIDSIMAAAEAVALASSIDHEENGLTPAEVYSIRLLKGRTLLQHARALLDYDNIVLNDRGQLQLQEALVHLRAALALEPAGFDAMSTLALVLQSYGAMRTATVMEDLNLCAYQKEGAELFAQLRQDKPLLFAEPAAEMWASHAESVLDRRVEHEAPKFAEAALSLQLAAESYLFIPSEDRWIEDDERLIELCHRGAVLGHKLKWWKWTQSLLQLGIGQLDNAPDAFDDDDDDDGSPKTKSDLGSLPQMLLLHAEVLIELEDYPAALAVVRRVKNLEQSFRSKHEVSPAMLDRANRLQSRCALMMRDVDGLLAAEQDLMRRVEAGDGGARARLWAWQDDNTTYLEALGELGAVQCALGRTFPAICTGIAACDLLEKLRKFSSGQTARMARNAEVAAYTFVYFVATLLEVHAEEARTGLRFPVIYAGPRLDIALHSVDDVLRTVRLLKLRLGVVEKTARVLRVRVLEAMGRVEEAQEERARAEAMVGFRGFADSLGRQVPIEAKP